MTSTAALEGIDATSTSATGDHGLVAARLCTGNGGSETAQQLLSAETVGLLLEPLALDEVLTGREFLAIAVEVADLRESDADEVAAVTELLESVVADAVRDAEHLGRIMKLHRAARHGVDLDTARVLLSLVRAGARRRHLVALKGVPPEALTATPAQLARTVRQLDAAVTAYDSAWTACQRHALPSAASLKLETEIRHLRAKGFLFGLISKESDAARDRVKRHLTLSAQELGAPAMADILERVRVAKLRGDDLTALLTRAPQWGRWLIAPDQRGLRADSVKALEWFHEARGTGKVGAAEASALADPELLRLLANPVLQRMRSHSPEESALHDRLAGRPALERLHQGLCVPPGIPGAELSNWRHVVVSAAPTLARAVLVMEISASDARVSNAITEVVARARSPFGPADPSRPLLRAIQSRLLSQVPDRGAPIDPIGTHPEVAALLEELRSLEDQTRSLLSATAPVRGPLQVAIAGRTKGGKTTLRKVLTRDTDPTGIGVGRQRTTRATAGFDWHGLRFIDTPGVAAYDDDYDADTARETCLAADAVVWVFSDTLRTEELTLLQGLMEAGKPLLLALNAKWKVDTPERLRLFARRPDVAFDDLDGQLTRVQQVSSAAGVRPPSLLQVQAGAALQAMLVGDEELAQDAWQASNTDVLETSLRNLLVQRAQAFRAVRLIDSLRVPVSLAHAAIDQAHPDLESQVELLGRLLTREERELQDAITAAQKLADRVLRTKISHVRAQVETFVKSVGKGDPHAAWQALLDLHDLGAVGGSFEQRFQAQWTSAGILLDAESRLEEQIARERLRVRTKRARGPWGYVRAVIWGLGKALAGLLGKRALAAKAARAGNPWVAAGIMAAAVVAAVAKEVSAEVRASDIEDRAWQVDASAAVHAAVHRLERAMHQALRRHADKASEHLTAHYDRASTDKAHLQARLDDLRALQQHLVLAVEQLDIVLVRRLLDLNGQDPTTVVRARRNTSRLDVWVSAPADRAALRRALQQSTDAVLDVDLKVHTASNAVAAGSTTSKGAPRDRSGHTSADRRPRRPAGRSARRSARQRPQQPPR